MRCPELVQAVPTIVLCICYAVSVTDIGCGTAKAHPTQPAFKKPKCEVGADENDDDDDDGGRGAPSIVLRPRYEMSGTDGERCYYQIRSWSVPMAA